MGKIGAFEIVIILLAIGLPNFSSIIDCFNTKK